MSVLPGVRANEKHRRVLARYLANGGDKVDAYYGGLDKTPSHKISKKIVRDNAYRYFGTPIMRALMTEADADVKLQLELKARAGLDTAIEKYGITKDRIMAELAMIAFARQTDVASWGPDGVIVKDSAEIGDAAAAVGEVTQSGGGEAPITMKVKLLDKRQALIDLGKEIGMFQPTMTVKGQVQMAVGAKFIIERD